MSVHCKLPLTENSTRVTPTLSVAVAVIVTFDLRATIALIAGFVIATVGAMLSAPAEKPILFTEPAPHAR